MQPNYMLLTEVIDCSGASMLVYFPKEMGEKILGGLSAAKYLIVKGDGCT
jgi:hypothetical protein